MKKSVFSFLIIVFASSLLSAQPEKEIKAELKHVTVFPDRAQLDHETTLQLSAGKSVLKLSSLSPYIDQQSIQVKGFGDFTILSVNLRNNYLQNLEEMPEVKAIRSQLEALQLKTEDEKAAIKVLQEKENFLVANRAILLQKTTFSLEQLKSVMDLFAINMEQITMSVLKKNRLIKDYEKQIAALQQQMAEKLGRQQLPSGELIVTVTADKPVSAKLSIAYVVSNAGWYPSYDIRVDDINKPVAINYKANLFQSSGVEWKDVRLTFSNATPWVAGNVTELYPWFIDYYANIQIRGVNKGAANRADAPVMMEMAVSKDVSEFKAAESAPVFVEKRIGETTISFDIATPYTIPSDGKVQTVEIQRLSAPAVYSYVATPKMAPFTYLTASVRDWAKLSLQSGEATLYFENSFVGKSNLDVNQLSDSLILSLGTDNSILVKREKRKDFTSSRVIGSNKTETNSWLLTVRNNKSTAVKVTLNDQIPLSSNSGISVETLELSGGILDTQSGLIKWNLDVKPQETKQIILTYSVKYPKDKKIILE